MNLQMDTLYNPLRTRPIQTGREMSMELYPNRQLGFINNPDCQSRLGSVPTCTRTRSDVPDLLLTLTILDRTDATGSDVWMIMWKVIVDTPQDTDIVHLIEWNLPAICKGNEDVAER